MLRTLSRLAGKESGMLHWDKRVGKFFYLQNRIIPHASSDPEDQPRIAAIDPGIANFVAYCHYSPNDASFGRVHGFRWTIKRRLKRIDAANRAIVKLQQRNESIVNGVPRYSYRRRRARFRLRKMWRHLHNLIRHQHYKIAKYLFSKYSVLLIPVLGVPRMVKWTSRSLRKPTVRELLALSHGMFLQRLKARAAVYSPTLGTPKRVIVTTEYRTSETCGYCGRRNRLLSLRDRTWTCGSRYFHGCGAELDRDINGARNIWLQYYGSI